VKTLLERAKGCPLDVIIKDSVPVSTTMLLSSHTKQIKYLDFPYKRLEDIQKLSGAHPGPLPLLHTLRIFIDEDDSMDDFDTVAPPSPFLFSNAVDLKILCVNPDMDLSPSPPPFIFPNLVSFDLFAKPFDEDELFSASQLLDFLETSPMLQTVHVKIIADISLEDIPQERVIVLPNVENLTLIVSSGERGYKLAAHISCPSARHTSLTYEGDIEDEIPDQIFPDPVSWNAIVPQYTKSPVEEVTLKISTTPFITCKLTFRSADATLIELCFNVADQDEDWFDGGLYNEVFTKAASAVRNHPQLANVKRLHIGRGFRPVNSTEISQLANEAGKLFESLGPLDELTIYCCALRPYFHSFAGPLEYDVREPVVFPPIKKLTISHPHLLSNEECTTAIVGFVTSQHKRGIPFERVVIHTKSELIRIEERLRPWVGSVECLHVGDIDG
jgi:hypothetical protein